MNRVVIYLIFVTICLLAVLYTRFGQASQKRKRSYVPYYALLCVFFSVEPIHVVIGEFLGLSNFSWLLSYWCLVIGCYLAVRDNLISWDILPKYLSKIATLTSILLTGIYLIWIMRSYEYPAHDYPRDVGDLLFMLIAYGYTVLMLLILVMKVYPYRKMLHDEKNAIVRARLLIQDSIYYLIILGFGLKFILTILLFVYPRLPYADFLLSMSRFLMIMGGNLSLVSLVISPAGLARVDKIRSYFKDWLKLIRLQIAIYQLARTYQVSVSLSLSLWQAIVSPTLYIEGQILCIADMIKQIQARFDVSVAEILHMTDLMEQQELNLLLDQP